MESCSLDLHLVFIEWYLENLVTEFGFTDPFLSKSLRTLLFFGYIHIKASWNDYCYILYVFIRFRYIIVGGCCATLQLMFVHLPNIPY